MSYSFLTPSCPLLCGSHWTETLKSNSASFKYLVYVLCTCSFLCVCQCIEKNWCIMHYKWLVVTVIIQRSLTGRQTGTSMSCHIHFTCSKREKYTSPWGQEKQHPLGTHSRGAFFLVQYDNSRGYEQSHCLGTAGNIYSVFSVLSYCASVVGGKWTEINGWAERADVHFSKTSEVGAVRRTTPDLTSLK